MRVQLPTRRISDCECGAIGEQGLGIKPAVATVIWKTLGGFRTVWGGCQLANIRRGILSFAISRFATCLQNSD
jgi:hypothetical protein